MEFEELRERVCAVNRAIGELGLSPLTWGNASAADREAKVFAIKPSGIPYANLQPDQIAVVRMEDGAQVGGGLKPSSDSASHAVIYRNWPNVNGIVHAHSPFATVWAQACKALPCLGTTHADHFCGSVPITRDLTNEEVEADYVENTGNVIVETATDPEGIPAVLVARHAPFVWGPTIEAALENAIALECIAEIAFHTLVLDPEVSKMSEALLTRHFVRKHGPDATYGQG